MGESRAGRLLGEGLVGLNGLRPDRKSRPPGAGREAVGEGEEGRSCWPALWRASELKKGFFSQEKQGAGALRRGVRTASVDL